jgi:thymidylate synthase ThyX
MIEAKVIEDSISEAGARLTTLQLVYPRFIHAEFLTHRVLSRNASSSRAIPVAKMIEQVRTNPAMPIHWGKNQPGMQAHEELRDLDKQFVQDCWLQTASEAALFAEMMEARGAHKQLVNRILEPFQHIHVVATATEWANFFELRAHPDAQPEIHELALQMRAAMDQSEPTLRILDRTDAMNWHLPYVAMEERYFYREQPELLAKASGARCARTSYLTHDGKNPVIEKDLGLYERLVGSRPLHASPTENQGYPMRLATAQSKNFRGWRQWRERVEQEVFGAAA